MKLKTEMNARSMKFSPDVITIIYNIRLQTSVCKVSCLWCSICCQWCSIFKACWNGLPPEIPSRTSRDRHQRAHGHGFLGSRQRWMGREDRFAAGLCKLGTAFFARLFWDKDPWASECIFVIICIWVGTHMFSHVMSCCYLVSCLFCIVLLPHVKLGGCFFFVSARKTFHALHHTRAFMQLKPNEECGVIGSPKQLAEQDNHGSSFLEFISCDFKNIASKPRINKKSPQSKRFKNTTSSN